MTNGSAKEKVISICETLSIVCPTLPDNQIQEMAIDLHDIEQACRKVADAISSLRKVLSSSDDVKQVLWLVEDEMYDHVYKSHLKTLRINIKRFSSEINAREHKVMGS
jgi:hypothetical protein